jgi:transcriptional regulator with XRE-family HTH domain
LTQREFGAAIGYAGNLNTIRLTINRYERGKRPIPPWIATLVLYMQRFGLLEE